MVTNGIAHRLNQQPRDRLASVGDGHWAIAVVKILGVVHPHRTANGRKEIGDRDRAIDDIFGQFVSRAERTTMVQSATCEHARKRFPLMPATATAIKFRRTPELTRDDNQRLIKQSFLSQIIHKSGDGIVEFTNQLVLLFDSRVVDVPTGTVQEVKIVGNLDESNASFDQPSTEQTALSEFTAIIISQSIGFRIEFEHGTE
jgi:hypothetical protein